MTISRGLRSIRPSLWVFLRLLPPSNNWPPFHAQWACSVLFAMFWLHPLPLRAHPPLSFFFCTSANLKGSLKAAPTSSSCLDGGVLACTWSLILVCRINRSLLLNFAYFAALATKLAIVAIWYKLICLKANAILMPLMFLGLFVF